MKKMSLCTFQGTKSLYEATKEEYEGVKKLSELLVESTCWFDGKPHLTPEEENALQWAKEFMDNYERKHKRKIDG